MKYASASTIQCMGKNAIECSLASTNRINFLISSYEVFAHIGNCKKAACTELRRLIPLDKNQSRGWRYRSLTYEYSLVY